MKKLLVTLLLTFLGINCSFAQVKWQLGLNSVPLVNYVKIKVSDYYDWDPKYPTYNPFIPSPTNYFLLKRINKNNAWRFSVDFKFKKNFVDRDKFFNEPYQLKIGALAGFEKRHDINKKILVFWGLQFNPTFSINYETFNFSNFDYTEEDRILEFNNGKYLALYSSGLLGTEFKFNKFLSISLETHLLFNYSYYKTNSYVVGNFHNGQLSSKSVYNPIETNEFKIKFIPISFFNLNFTFP